MRKVIESRRGGRVVMDGAEVVMLGSNDYLGLSLDARVIAATTEALARYGTGTGLYPVFATTPLHDELSAALASFLGVEDVALYSSGGSANAGALATLAGAGDLILSDRLNHASIIDGCRLSRADVVAYDNRNVESLTAALAAADTARRKLIVTDGIFSMEGGAAPIPEIYALAREHGALLMIDEAHASGVVGLGGAGTAPSLGVANGAPGIVLTGSLSKAIGGASGGFVAGSCEAIAKLKRESRSWIFTMGMTTANAATALAALKLCASDPSIRKRLWANVSVLRTALSAQGVDCFDSDSAITAARIGDEDRARRVAESFLRAGFYAPAVAYPVVARGEARLRLQASATHEACDLKRATQALADAIAEAGR